MSDTGPMPGSTEPTGPPAASTPAVGSEARREPDLFAEVVSRLLGGPLAFGGLGWALDHWLGTAFLLPVGAIVGMALSLYVVWLRYGTE